LRRSGETISNTAVACTRSRALSDSAPASRKEVFERLKLCELELSRTVLRGRDRSNVSCHSVL
jgi:hypothetical protein